MKLTVVLKREALEQDLRNRKRIGINTEEMYYGPEFEDSLHIEMADGFVEIHTPEGVTYINADDIHAIVSGE